MPAKAVVGEGIETMPLGRRQRFPTKEVYVRPSGPSPVRALAQFCGTGGMAVEAHVAPNQAVADSRGGRVLRVLLVWGVRFTGECLVDILERDPLVSVARTVKIAEPAGPTGVNVSVAPLTTTVVNRPGLVLTTTE